MLFKNSTMMLYLVKHINSTRIYCHNLKNRDYDSDSDWLSEDFSNIKLLWVNNGDKDGFCYALIKNTNGSAFIIELVKKKNVIENFKISNFRASSKRNCGDILHEREDVTACFIDRKTKMYAVFSLTVGLLFGPYNYKEIDDHIYGVILDGRYAVENNGLTIDLFNYEQVENWVYKNKSDNSYLFMLDEDGQLFHKAHKDTLDDDFRVVSLKKGEYRYNIISGGSKYSQYIDNDDEDMDWSKYNDTVFEGHSMLELGLED